MKQIYTLLLCLPASLGFSQIGINTSLPNATLDITGQPSDASKLDGLIAPRITGDQLRAKTYTASQTGAVVYVTAKDSTPSGQTAEVLNPGYYFFNGSKWVGLATSNVFVPSVVVSGRATNEIVQYNNSNYTRWNFTSTKNDGNWNTATNTYTVPVTGYYQLSLIGKVTPNLATNSFGWHIKYGSQNYVYKTLSNVQENIAYNDGGVIILYLIQGTVVEFGGYTCYLGCPSTGFYTVGERSFTIVSLGS